MNHKILCVADLPGWAIDLFCKQWMPKLPEYDWTYVYWTETRPEQMAELVQAHDVVFLANHDYGWRFWDVFAEAMHPRVILRFCSWRYTDDALRFARDFAKAVVCANQNLARQLFPYNSNLWLIQEGIQEGLVPFRPVRVGFVGEVCEYKGFHLIQEACRQFGADLVVKARTHERISVAEMARWYESVDCIIVASENEGYNTILVEAMAMNKPVLTTAVGAAQYLDCLIIDRSVEGILTGLNRLFGRRQVTDRFGWPRVVASYRELFSSLL